MTPNQRVLIVAVDDTDNSERACQWALDNLYRQGDDVHLLHVVPRLTVAAQYGAPPIDLLPQQDPWAYETLLKEAEEFVKTRFIPKFKDLLIEPIVHLIKSEVDADAIGRVICKKADDLGACAVVMAKRNQPRIKEFFMGSVCKFCVANCKYPVVVIH